MNKRMMVKLTGVAVMAFIFYHQAGAWGLALAAAFGMILIP